MKCRKLIRKAITKAKEKCMDWSALGGGEEGEELRYRGNLGSR